MNLLDEFKFEEYYHVFSRSNNKEMLFRNPENRRFFLEKIGIYIKPYFEIHAYALMGNHYHLLVKVKSLKEIFTTIKGEPEDKRTKAMNRLFKEIDTCLVSKTRQVSISLNIFLVHQIQRLSISYTKALNKQLGRQGHLFNRPFKRSSLVFNLKYHYIIYYIHHNARKHGFVQDFLEYPYHSYFEIINKESMLINCDVVMANFGGREKFIKFHSTLRYQKTFGSLNIEQEG